MKRVLPGVVVVTLCVMVSVTGALAQRAGQMATIRYGTVVGMQTVDLNKRRRLEGRTGRWCIRRCFDQV